MSVFNGTAENIENNLNKVTSVDENSTDEQYPSAKLLFKRTGDYPVEIGTNGIWNYEKRASGLCEMWGKTTSAANITDKAGESYRSFETFSENFPFEFKEPPVCFPMATSNFNDWPIHTLCSYDATTIKTTTVRIAYHQSAADVPISINWYVKGYLTAQETLINNLVNVAEEGQ